jgi:hypothetical protein
MRDEEADKETRRRMRSVLAKDLLQVERSMEHYDIRCRDPFLRLCDNFWYAAAKQTGQPYEHGPSEWWHKPETWEQ